MDGTIVHCGRRGEMQKNSKLHSHKRSLSQPSCETGMCSSNLWARLARQLVEIFGSFMCPEIPDWDACHPMLSWAKPVSRPKHGFAAIQLRTSFLPPHALCFHCQPELCKHWEIAAGDNVSKTLGSDVRACLCCIKLRSHKWQAMRHSLQGPNQWGSLADPLRFCTGRMNYWGKCFKMLGQMNQWTNESSSQCAFEEGKGAHARHWAKKFGAWLWLIRLYRYGTWCGFFVFLSTQEYCDKPQAMKDDVFSSG